MFSTKTKFAGLLLGLVVALAVPVAAQRTVFRTGTNSFTTQQDIEMGRALARDADSTLTLSDDTATRGYIRTLGNELAGRAPGYKFPYEFRVFVDPDIRSMALPGGIIYLSSGLVLAMPSEPQLAAFLAHQIGHVSARHGSEQVSAEYSRLTNRFGRVSVNDAISRLNLTAGEDSLVSRYNSQNEQQADTIATQILYDTRFDPRQIPTVFQNLRQNDRSGDLALSHPTPPNRTAAIRRELQQLGPLPGWRTDSAAFRTALADLKNEIPFGLASRDDTTVIPPSTRWTTYQGVDFEIRYPDNWRVDESGNSSILAPDGGNVSGGLAYGMMINTFQPESQNAFGRNSFAVPNQSLRASSVSTATDQLIDELRRSNPHMRVIRKTSKRIDGFDAMAVDLNNDSPLGGVEVDHLTAVLHTNGELYYFLGVAPQADNSQYAPLFERMAASIRFY